MGAEARRGKTLGEAKPGLSAFLVNAEDSNLPAGSNKIISVRCSREGCLKLITTEVKNLVKGRADKPKHVACGNAQRPAVAPICAVRPDLIKFLENPVDQHRSSGSNVKIKVFCSFDECQETDKAFTVSVNNLSRINGFPAHLRCSIRRTRKLTARTIENTRPDAIHLLIEDSDKYKGGAEKVRIRCEVCGVPMTASVSNLLDNKYFAHKGCAVAAASAVKYGTTMHPVKVEVVTECLRAGMSDTELHLFLPALGLKADARAVRTRFNQGLDVGEAVRESAAGEGDEELTGDEELSADESAALLNAPAPDADDERSPEDKLQDELDGMDAIQSAINKTTPLHRDRLAPIVETIVSTRVNGFWQTVFDAEYDGKAVAPIVRKVKGMTPNSQIAKDVQQRFLEEFAEVAKVKAPKVYRGHKLRLMQRRIMHLLANRPYLGNWSGTGSGKTIAALCSALHVDSTLSVVVCPNPVKSTWLAEIKNVFGERVEVAAPSSGDDWAATTGRILVLNYECFQQEYSEAKVHELLAQRGHEIGLFILDECHYAKLDESAPKESERRKVITAFMNGAPGAKRLAMSATPVVNNLSEAKRLIETLTGESPAVSTRPTVANCIALYQELVKYGIRWRSEYREITVLKPEIVAGAVVGPTVVNIDAGDELHASLLEEKRRLGKAFTPLVIDQMTLPFKLDAIVASVGKREKAIVYTEYKEGVVDVIVGAFNKKGYRVAAFDGDTSEDDRAGVLADFQGSKVNVIVATSAITTGIDGLQHCRKMIIASLPFTHARFMQLLGRIVRPTADKSPRTVEIVLPLVTTMGWSGDVIRFKRIASKGSISASAIDGTVPTFDDSSRRELERSIVKALEQSSEAPTNPAA